MSWYSVLSSQPMPNWTKESTKFTAGQVSAFTIKVAKILAWNTQESNSFYANFSHLTWPLSLRTLHSHALEIYFMFVFVTSVLFFAIFVFNIVYLTTM